MHEFIIWKTFYYKYLDVHNKLYQACITEILQREAQFLIFYKEERAQNKLSKQPMLRLVL